MNKVIMASSIVLILTTGCSADYDTNSRYNEVEKNRRILEANIAAQQRSIEDLKRATDMLRIDTEIKLREKYLEDEENQRQIKMELDRIQIEQTILENQRRFR